MMPNKPGIYQIQSIINSKRYVGSADLGRKGANYFVIDHCHKTGEIRGLLCYKCNIILGLCNDNPDILINGALYLKD